MLARCECGDRGYYGVQETKASGGRSCRERGQKYDQERISSRFNNRKERNQGRVLSESVDEREQRATEMAVDPRAKRLD